MPVTKNVLAARQRYVQALVICPAGDPDDLERLREKFRKTRNPTSDKRSKESKEAKNKAAFAATLGLSVQNILARRSTQGWFARKAKREEEAR